MGDGHAGRLPHQPIAEHHAQRNGLAPPLPGLPRRSVPFGSGGSDLSGSRCSEPAPLGVRVCLRCIRQAWTALAVLEGAGNLIANTRRRCPSRKVPNQMLTQGAERLYLLKCMNGRQLLTENEVRPILHLSESAPLKERTSTRTRASRDSALGRSAASCRSQTGTATPHSAPKSDTRSRIAFPVSCHPEGATGYPVAQNREARPRSRAFVRQVLQPGRLPARALLAAARSRAPGRRG